MANTIGILGLGKMGEALVRGMLDAGVAKNRILGTTGRAKSAAEASKRVWPGRKRAAADRRGCRDDPERGGREHGHGMRDGQGESGRLGDHRGSGGQSSGDLRAGPGGRSIAPGLSAARGRVTSGRQQEETAMDLGIRGKRALVCASSKGLGRGCAEALAEAGCTLVMNARGAEALEAAAVAIRERFGVEVIERRQVHYRLKFKAGDPVCAGGVVERRFDDQQYRAIQQPRANRRLACARRNVSQLIEVV